MEKSKNFDTKLIHSGEPHPRIGQAVTMPIFQSSTFEHDSETHYHDIKYARLSNTPNHKVLGEKIAALENGESALVTSSGMSAISATLLAFLKSGDHVLVQNCLYGGTHSLLTQDLLDLGIKSDFIDANDPKSWATKLKPETKMIYVETMSNPLLEIPDFNSVVDFARTKKIKSVIDNTFASPLNFRPLEMGFDLSIHSATKYLNGHSDIVAGAVIGKKEDITSVTHKLDHLGGSLDPHACFLLQRGIKTLAVRVRYQNESALQIAQYLSKHPGILRVNYPGLDTHPQHSRAKEFFAGFSGMMSFRLKGGLAAANSLIEKLSIPIHAPSLGGVESLITRPAFSSHGGASAEQRNKMGITDDLIRLSVGLESTEDLIKDFENAI